jgi:hypothetical protein
MMLVTEDGNGEGEVMGCSHFSEGEEARRLHGAGGGRHSEERRGGEGGRRRASIKKSKTTKGNRVGGLNGQLG